MERSILEPLKSTPWGTDRRVFQSDQLYKSNIKPTVCTHPIYLPDNAHACSPVKNFDWAIFTYHLDDLEIRRNKYGGDDPATHHPTCTSLVPSPPHQSRLYDTSNQWHQAHVRQSDMLTSAEDIVSTMVDKLEQRCKSTHLLTRMFKLFDRDNSSTIDA